MYGVLEKLHHTALAPTPGYKILMELITELCLARKTPDF